MIRRLLIPLLGSGLLLAAGAGTTLGKCEGPNPPSFCQEILATLDVGGSGGIFRADTATSVDIHVSQAEQPFAAVGVRLSFTHAADRTVVRTEALPTGQPGTWRAEVTLPTDGTWTVVAAIVEANGSAFNVRTDSIQVATAPATPGTPTTPAPPVSPTTPALPIALLLAGLAAAALLVTGVRDRARRRAAGAAGAAAATASTPSAASGERA